MLGLSPIIPVVRRVFPTHRGLYEDYVANVWFAISPIFKLSKMDQKIQLLVSTSTTAIGFLPASLRLMICPSFRRFLLCLMTTSLSFFLFSFQVHEKGILLPLLPVLLLLPEMGVFSVSFVLAACFSLYPLSIKDHSLLSFMALTVFWTATSMGLIPFISTYRLPPGGVVSPINAIIRQMSRGRRRTESGSGVSVSEVSEVSALVLYAVIGGCCTALLAKVIVTPPDRYPYMHDYLMCLLCAPFFLLTLFVGTVLTFKGEVKEGKAT
eukprot:GHVN01071813.1.p2 GENE.GHVN01071813.1~~GHVN01071813.1.p2  ORF type:complete len:267 (-),score=47.16 GHVN01071813.1:242-1042(-)